MTGAVAGPVQVEWTSRDTLLYAVAIGVGSADALTGLKYTTENSSGVGQEVLGTYAAVIAQNAALPRDLGNVDPSNVLHAGQELRIMRELPAAGVISVRQATTALYDKGSGALAVIESVGRDPGDGAIVFTSKNLSFIRGAGGFGGDRGPRDTWVRPERSPDHVTTLATAANQALIYRLCGDRNPLHSDPAFAAAAGFPRPILHGLATMGVVVRAVGELAGIQGTLARREIRARFARPVTPGDTLTVRAWSDGDRVLFDAALESGLVALTHGVVGLIGADPTADHQTALVEPVPVW
jgi:acyl dehydratase